MKFRVVGIVLVATVLCAVRAQVSMAAKKRAILAGEKGPRVRLRHGRLGAPLEPNSTPTRPPKPVWLHAATGVARGNWSCTRQLELPCGNRTILAFRGGRSHHSERGHQMMIHERFNRVKENLPGRGRLFSLASLLLEEPVPDQLVRSCWQRSGRGDAFGGSLGSGAQCR